MQERAAFTPTRWSLIAAVRSGEAPRVREALETLCEAYWYPLYAYVRRVGHGPEESADLTQSFFAHLMEKKVLSRADPERGRLRNFLLNSLQHFLRDEWRKQQRLKRGGGAPPLSIDAVVAEGLYANEPADLTTPETLYHRRWALTLLERTLLGLHAIKPSLIEDADAASAAESGARLGMAAGAVRVAIFRLRTRYRERLLAEVAASMDAQSEADLDEEIAALFRALS
jgi:DNA-directed RNA polymerase specialized sigma24 family protein